MELFRTKGPLRGLRGPLSTGVALAVLLLCGTPGVARANVFGDRFEFGMYGRVGLAWTPRGEIAQGKSLNVIDRNQIGGRFEEGDYLEPTLKAYIVKGKEKQDLDVSMNLTFQFFNQNGAFIQAISSGESPTVRTEIFQAFVEAKNLGVPDLTVWGGARQYRGQDIHIADYYYFNDLNGQGGGVKYKGLDLAVIIHTAPPPDPLYNVDTNGDGVTDLQRQRTVFVGQYKYDLTGDSFAQGLAEFHLLPANRRGDGPVFQEADYGWAVGAKLHLALQNGSLNSVSLRYGTGIANGAWGGSRTYETFGIPDPDDGTFKGTSAYGVEAVDHFLWNFGPLFSLNAYGVLHLNHGAADTDATDNKRMDWAVGARSFVYLTDRFHLINEATYQQRKDGEDPVGSALKLSVVPTLVPTGERSPWARPHLRLIYTIAIYNDHARDNELSPYLQAFGASRTGHYIGARAEWWF
jgi:maltoporin